MNEIITEDGEVIESLGTSSMAVQLQRAEIDQAITTARAYPRSLKRVQSAIMNMATLDEESAEECMYALPRGGKPIKGPSVRFAEILKQAYGNCRAAARVVHVDRTEGYVEAEGIFHDLETNSSSTTRVRRRITDKRGKVFTDDMIIVTGNAACSIAKRNAILDGVPKPLWRKAYEVVQATITGDVTTLSENRDKAMKALAAFGVTPGQVFGALGREGMEDVTVDDIATLRGMYSALKNGEATVEEMFVGTVKQTSEHDKVKDPLSDEPEPAKKPNEQQDEQRSAEAEDASTTPNSDDAPLSQSSDEAGESPSPADTDGDGSAPSQEPSPSEEEREPGQDDDQDYITDKERDILIRYARSMLDAGADPKKDRAQIEKMHGVWKAGDFKNFGQAALEKAKSIFDSAQAIARNDASFDAAVSFFEEMLDAEGQIGGVDA